MNRINTLTATNIKGQSFTHTLGAVNVICGSNFSGKTAVLSAVRLALLGYEPEFGRRNQDTFMACGATGGATSMSVQAVLGDMAINREWTMKRGTVSYNGSDAEHIKLMLLDPTAFFNLTGPAQLNYVLSQCDMAALGLGHGHLMQKIEADVKTDGDGSNALAEIGSKLMALEFDRQQESASVYDWLVAAVDWLKQQAAEAAKLASNADQTVKGLVAANAAEADMSAVQSVQPQITAARARHTEAITIKANADTALATATKQLAEARRVAGSKVDAGETQATIAELRAAIAKASAVPDAGQMPTPPPPGVMPGDTNERLAQSKAANELARAGVYREQCEKALEAVMKELDAVDALTCCTACGQTIPQSARQATKAAVQTKVDAAKANLVTANERLATAQAAEQQATDALQAVLNTQAAIRTEVENALAKHRTEMEQWRAASKAYHDSRNQIAEANRRIIALEQALAAGSEAEQAAAKVPGLEQLVTDMQVAVNTAVDVCNKIVQEINALEVQQRKFVARTAEARRIDQCRADAEAATAKATVFKQVLKVVAEEKERASTDAFKQLLVRARLFTDGILKAPLEYRDGELGMTWQDNWVSYRVFSGTEKLLAFAGLSVALTQNEEMTTRVVLMDELGRLDATIKAKVADRMWALTQEGVIDQFIGCDVSSKPWSGMDGINVITVAEAPAAA